MTIQQFHNNLRDNQIVNDYIAYMKDTLGGGYINYYFEDGGQHYSGAPLPQFKYHNVKGNLHPVVWGGNIKTNLIQHLFGSTEKFFNGMCVFGEFTGSISAGSYGSKQGFIRPYMKSKDSDRNEQWQYVISLRTGKKFLGDKYWAPANADTNMEFYKYLGLAKNAVRVVQKESQKVLHDALERLIDAIQNDADYITWKESDKVGASAEEVAPELKLSEVYYALKSLVKPGMRLDQSEDDEIQCSIRHWGRWDSDFDSDREEEDYEDDDYEVLSDASDQALNKIVSEIKEKFPQVDIDWGTSEKNWIDFTITRIANESLVTEAESYVTDKFKVGDKIKTGFGEWEIIETDYAPKKSFMGPFIFKGDDMKRVNIPNPPKTNKNAVGYKVTDGDKYPIIGFLYQYKDITKLATVGVDESNVNELRSDMISGNSGRRIESLEDRKYELKKDVEGAQIGNYVNITLPKGTTIYNLPGGVHADHKSLKKYADRNSNIYFEKPTFSGIRIKSMPTTLADIEKNSKVLENKEIINEASYSGNEIYEIATPAPKSMLKEELEELFGDDYRNIVTEFNSPEGLESVLMMNITKKDIEKIRTTIGDVLIYSLQLGGRKVIN